MTIQTKTENGAKRHAPPPRGGGHSARASLGVGCKATAKTLSDTSVILKQVFPWKILFFKGKAFLIDANAWEDNLYVSAFEKYPALAETRNSSTQHWTQRESQWDPEQIQELSTPQPPPRGYTSSLTTIFAAQKPYCLVFSLNFPSIWGGTDERTHLWSSRFALPTTNELCLSKRLVGSQSQLLQRPGWCSAGEELHKTRISAVLSQNLNVFFSPKKCLEHNSARLYKEDKQNCLEMEENLICPN